LKFFYLLICISFLIPSNSQFKYIKSITSILNPKDVIVSSENLIVSTEGGLYSYNRAYDDIDVIIDNLKYKSINSINVDSLGRIWIGSSNPGVIQILNDDFNLDYIIDYQMFDQIDEITFSDDYVFCTVKNNNRYGVVQYSNNDFPNYLNIYDQFLDDDMIIKDLNVYNDSIYIATNKGLLSASVDNDFLMFSSSWNKYYENQNIQNIFVGDGLYFFVDNQLYKDFSLYLCCFDNNINIIQSMLNENNIYSLTDNSFYEGTNIVYEISENFNFVDFEILNNKFYLAIENNGLLVLDQNFNILDKIIPNTLFKNDYSSIYLMDNDLIGISKDGGFLLENSLSLSNSRVKNFYSFNSSRDFILNGKYPNYMSLDINKYYGKYLMYLSGGGKPLSIIGENNTGYFLNTNLYPELTHPHYSKILDSLIANNMSVENIYLGSLLEIDFENLEISESWGSEIFSGLGGITSNSTDGFMVVNDLFKDQEGLYILNPYAENNYVNNDTVNVPIACKNNNNDWTYFSDENLNNLIPTEMTKGPFNNFWLAYQSYNNYSYGGIRVIENNDSGNWYNGLIEELVGVNVWSLDFGKDQSGNDILWVISDLGVMGYQVLINQTILNTLDFELNSISPYYYYSEIPFNIESKVRVDYQQNAWITTPGYGLKIIKNNGELWPDNSGINSMNSNLLSDVVNDVIFDENGYVFIATDKGISVIETVFSDNVSVKNISVSPNPFFTDQDSEIIISNYPSGSKIQIITLEGRLIKEFPKYSYNSIFNWDGKDNQGNKIQTGIYLVVASHPTRSSGTTKIAIIN
tara:strand:- start:10975 stop:13386 length:2412 start_codon:yes stop_codon:yes gene_type:complete